MFPFHKLIFSNDCSPKFLLNLTIIFMLFSTPCFSKGDLQSKKNSINNNNKFAFDLMHHIQNKYDDRNYVVSTQSIYQLLGLLGTGAAGQTLEEISKATGLPQSPKMINQEVNLLVTRTTRPRYFLGVRGIENNGYGILVTEIASDSPASKAGISVKDLIFKIDGNTVRSETEFIKALDRANKHIKLQYYRFKDGRLIDSIVNLDIKPQKANQFRLRNSIWYQKGINLKSGFLKSAHEFYEAFSQEVDFKSKPNEALNKINQWAKAETQGQIDDFLKTGSINADTRVILLNSVYFNNDWLYEFNLQKTGIFHCANDQNKQIKYNNVTAKVRYLKNPELTFLELPYANKNFVMTIVLPSKNIPLSSFVEKVTHTDLSNWISETKLKLIDISIPTFAVETKLSYKEILPQIGIKKLFTKSADLSQISSQEDLYVSDFIQACKISVSNKGTVASSTTSATLSVKSAPVKPEIFIADRPFLFFIRSVNNSSILFLGKISSVE